jgi:gamma-glutamylcyclotransferase (GGCT)/AIG2-like uncharacterized protein YtfP
MTEESKYGKVMGGVFVYDEQAVKEIEELLVSAIKRKVHVVLSAEDAEALLRKLESLRAVKNLTERQSEFERGVRYAREAHMYADRVCVGGNGR